MSAGTQGDQPARRLVFRRSSRALGRPALPADGDALWIFSVRSDLCVSVSQWHIPVDAIAAWLGLFSSLRVLRPLRVLRDCLSWSQSQRDTRLACPTTPRWSLT